jgi:hypothetical protein
MKRKHRRLRYAGLKAEFMLAGGHKDWLVPFNHAWLKELSAQIRSIEEGNPYFTKPKGYIHGYTGTTTGRVQQWRDEYPSIANAWQAINRV